MKISTLPLLVLLSTTIACQKKTEPNNYTNCNFSYQPEATELKWTAYKFTEKVAVSGKMKNFSLNKTQTAKDITDIFAGAEFTVDSMSIDSGNEERDGKIKQYFFSNLAQKGKITGRFIKENSLSAEITLNNNTQKVPLSITQKSPLEYSAKLNLDLTLFKAQNAIKKLNQACYQLHTGADGVSKLWPEVTIEINTKLKAECPS